MELQCVLVEKIVCRVGCNNEYNAAVISDEDEDVDAIDDGNIFDILF